MPLDVHLMVHEPSNSYIKGFIDAGANSITIHEEACKNPSKQINFIKKNKHPNQTIILITHELELTRYANKIIHIRDGEIYYGGKNENCNIKYLYHSNDSS